MVCGGGSPAVAATAAAGPRKRGRAEAESAEVAGAARRQLESRAELARVDALASTLREELIDGGLPATQLRLRPVLLREVLLPQLPVVRGGSAEKASPEALAVSVQAVLGSKDVPPFDGLRRLITEGSAVNISMSD